MNQIGSYTVIEKTMFMGVDIFIGNNVTIREGASIGDRVVIGHNCVLEKSVFIGADTHIQAQTHLTNGCIVEEKVFFGVGVITGDDKIMAYLRVEDWLAEPPLIKRAARIGSGATLLPGVIIGENAVIGAGSIVTKNVPDCEMWIGTPARYYADVPREHCI